MKYIFLWRISFDYHYTNFTTISKTIRDFINTKQGNTLKPEAGIYSVACN